MPSVENPVYHRGFEENDGRESKDFHELSIGVWL
jgi:hypothetical protein